nr:hypothetical protein [uncultured Allomuricauda sp.]
MKTILVLFYDWYFSVRKPFDRFWIVKFYKLRSLLGLLLVVLSLIQLFSTDIKIKESIDCFLMNMRLVDGECPIDFMGSLKTNISFLSLLLFSIYYLKNRFLDRIKFKTIERRDQILLHNLKTPKLTFEDGYEINVFNKNKPGEEAIIFNGDLNKVLEYGKNSIEYLTDKYQLPGPLEIILPYLVKRELSNAHNESKIRLCTELTAEKLEDNTSKIRCQKTNYYKG